LKQAPLINDKFTPIVTRKKITPFGYIRRMRYMMSTKEKARMTVIKGAINGAGAKLSIKPSAS
jgi:uncharacterized protein YaiE (UPF0345 family)